MKRDNKNIIKSMMKAMLILAIALGAVLMPAGPGGIVAHAEKTTETLGGFTFYKEDGYYLIENSTDLGHLATYSQSNDCSGLKFKQTSDINVGKFKGIGSYSTVFHGTYEGGGHKITGLDMNDEKNTQYYWGFLRNAYGASVSNLIFINPQVKRRTESGIGMADVGALGGYVRGSNFTNIIIYEPEVAGYRDIGAVIGYSQYNNFRGVYYYASGSNVRNAIGRNDVSSGYAAYIYRMHTLTVGSGVSVASDPSFTYNGKTYYGQPLLTATATSSGMKKFTTTAGSFASTTEANTVKLTADTFENVTVSLSSVTPTITVSEATYTGTEQKPAVTVKIGENTLTENKDYTLAYSNNINAGNNSATATVTGKGMYIGSTSKKFSIKKGDGPAAPTGLLGVAPTTVGGDNGMITGVSTAMEYSTSSSFGSKTACTGTEITGLTAGDYYVRKAETDNRKAGEAVKVVVPECVETTYDISFEAGNGGSGSMDTVTVKENANYTLPDCGFTVSAGKQFIKWQIDDDTENLKSVGDTITITKDTVIKAIYKDLILISDSNITVDDLIYTGSFLNITVKLGETTLTPNTDYTVVYNKNGSLTSLLNAGEYTAIISGKGDYYGTVTKEFTVDKASLTVTARDNTITYGDVPANNGVEYSGFVGDESESNLSGTLSYSYTYNQYNDVGSYFITPDGVTSENYEITFVPGTLNVEQKEVGLKWSDEALTFNGKSQAPEVSITGLVNNDDVSAVVSGAQTNAGNDYTATAESLDGTKSGNYKLPDTNTKTFSIGKAAKQKLSNINLVKFYQVTEITAFIEAKMPEDAGDINYLSEEESIYGNATITDWSVDGLTGAVTAVISGGTENDIIIMPVKVSSTNYEDSTVNVIVTLKDKTNAGVTITGDNTKTFGDRMFSLTGEVLNAGNDGVWSWTSSNEEVATVSNSGEVKITNRAGTTIITAYYESDMTKGSKTLELTVNPKVVTIPSAVEGLKWTGDEQTGVADGDAYTVTNGTGTDVGNYVATVSLISTTNFKWDDNTTEDKEISWSIGKADEPAEPDGPSGVTPTGAVPTPVVSEAVVPKTVAPTPAATEAVKNNEIIYLNSVKQKGNKVNVSWTKVSEADGYDVYIQYFGNKAKKPAKTINNNSTTKASVTKINGKKIDQKKNFFVYVAAYQMVDGNKVNLSNTITAYVAGAKNGKYANPKTLKLNKSKLSIAAGKTAKITAKVTLAKKNKKHLPKKYGAKLRFMSSDTGVATVTKDGKIQGIKAGTCDIYVYTINGFMKKVNVTVK